jgi:hypothetical protein
MRLRTFLVVAIVLIAMAWCVAYLSWPFGWDQGIIALVGRAVASGGMPYRDSWDMKGPLAYVPFALSHLLFGPTAWGVRLLDLVFLGAAWASMSRASQRLGTGAPQPDTPRLRGHGGASAPIARLRPTFGFTGRLWVAPLLFATWYFSFGYWHTAQPDGWVAMLCAMAFAPLLRDVSRRDGAGPVPAAATPYLLAGLGIGAMLLIKPVYLLFAAAPFARVVREDRKVRNAVVLGAAIATPVVIAVAVFAMRHSFAEFLAVYVRYPAEIYASGAGSIIATRMRPMITFALENPAFALACVPAVAGFSRLANRRPTQFWVLLAWLMAAVAAVWLQGRWFLYHVVVIIPPMALPVAVGIDAARREGRERSAAQTGFRAGVVLLWAMLLVHPLVEFGRWARHVTGGLDEIEYADGFGLAGPQLRAIRYLERTTQPTDSMFLWGWDGAIPYLVDRVSPSRFTFAGPLMWGSHSETRQRYRAELMQVLRAQPPQVLVRGTMSDALVKPDEAVPFEDLEAFIQSAYRRDTVVAGYEIYRRLR